MAKPELGTKRICPVTGKKFYDLNLTPVVSPYTGEVVPIDAPPTRGGRAEHARAAAPAEVETPDGQGPEFVSLEEADAEATGAKIAPVEGEEAEEGDELVEEIEAGDEDDTFLEPSEDEDEDVSDIIGGDIEDEEET